MQKPKALQRVFVSNSFSYYILISNLKKIQGQKGGHQGIADLLAQNFLLPNMTKRLGIRLISYVHLTFQGTCFPLSLIECA
jgi:hypothetical protein